MGYKNMKSIRGDLSILFKGKGTKDEGEIFVVDHTSTKVSSIFMDVDDSKVQEAIDKAHKRKNKLKESVPDFVTISPFKDWKGYKVYDSIDDVPVQKFNVKCAFRVYETKVFSVSKAKITKEQDYINRSQFDTYREYVEFLVNQQMCIGYNNKTHNSTGKKQKPKYKVSDNSTKRFIEENSENPFSHRADSTRSKVSNVSVKTVTTKAWFTSEHFLSVSEFLPLLSILSYSSNHMNKIREFFSKLYVEDTLFPIKAEVPLKLSVKAVIMLQNFHEECDKPENFFRVDETYINHKLHILQEEVKLNTAPIPSNEQLKEIYAQLKMAYSDEEESDEENTEKINSMYEKMLISHSRVSSDFSNYGQSKVSEINSRDFSEHPSQNLVFDYKSIKIKTLKDVQK
jgi:hypothetical protein